MYSFGLGKQRTRLGRFIDRNGISQLQLTQKSGVSRNEISRLCDGSKDISPNEVTMLKIIGALRREGYDVSMSDFW
jgi:putative transcriptional regulator